MVAVSDEKCPYCDRVMDVTGAQLWSTRTKDHIVPKVLGGDNHPLNVTFCCRHCNQLKGGSTPGMLRELAREMHGKAVLIDKIANRVDGLMAARSLIGGE